MFIPLNGAVIIVQNGPFRSSPRMLNFILMELWTFAYYFSIMSNVSQFIYRYLMLCHRMQMTRFRHAMLLVIGALIVLVHNYLIYFAGGPSYTPQVIIWKIDGFF